ncbi:MAG: hypothetical protein JXA14_26065 [Anaerolineae bacterium]|nr:hypothetical protein [Anaerolineae bacterium]
MRRLAMPFALALLFTLFVTPAGGQQPIPGQETAQWVECDYPDGCTLHLAASVPVNRKGVHAWVDVTAADGTVTRIEAEPFPSGRFVEVEAIWRASPPMVLPWSEFSYQWTVLRDNGKTGAPLPAGSAEYEDDTLEWERQNGDGVIVFSYGHPVEEQAALLQSAQSGYDRMKAFLGITPKRPVRVLVYSSWQDFKQVLGFHDQMEITIGGEAFADQGITAQWSSCMDCLTQREIPHEIAHVFYEEIFPYASVPSWFAEGLAMRNEDHDFSDYEARVERMARDGDLVPMAQMGRARRHLGTNQEVIDWYAQSHQMVAYIETTYGAGRLRAMVHRLGAGQAFEDVVLAEAGHPQQKIEDDWRKSIKAAPVNGPIIEVNAQALEAKTRGVLWSVIDFISSPWVTLVLAILLLLAIVDRVRMERRSK